jgi:pimeloyl-ACP methyl ester carboxylesterase
MFIVCINIRFVLVLLIIYLEMNYYLLLIYILNYSSCTKDLTASSETLLWRPLVNKTIKGVSLVQEAYILVPADYENEDSPFIPVNIRRFYKQKERRQGEKALFPLNIWYVPGGPGQSSKSLELMLPEFMKGLPEGSTVYIVEHRGLGKSTPLANSEERSLLEKFPTDRKLLQEILRKKQQKLGIITPIIRALRVENVARDLLKGVELAKKEEGESRKNYLFGVSYGTMISRRALQIAPDGTFEAVLLDGLAPVERIEFSNESDRAIEEFCNLLPDCRRRIDAITPKEAEIKVRQIIPEILKNQANSCTAYFLTLMRGKGLCASLHDLLNSTLLQGRAKIKVAMMRLLFEMSSCSDPEGFKLLLDKVNKYLMNVKAVNQIQAAVVMSSNSLAKVPKVSAAADPQKALSADELVFDVVSALERYEVTENSVKICYNVKHTTNGDDIATCPARLFDPCVFFRMTYDRKMALMGINGVLPPISLQEPLVNVPKTRIMILAGNLDFNTPTWLSRQLAFNFTRGSSVKYHEFFGYGHAMFGSSDCDRELMSDFLTGSEYAGICALRWNMKNAWIINGYFRTTLTNLTNSI